MGNSPAKKWRPLVLLAVALMVWATLFAAGAYFEIGVDAPRRDIRKPLIILGCMAAFLTFWGLALLIRARNGSSRNDGGA